MRAEKKFISADYVERLNQSPFFLVIDYRGLRVGPITELRKRLHNVGARLVVVKNSLFKIAAQEAGIADLGGGTLTGQLAVITGQQDIAATAKVVKTFKAEFDRPQFRFGYLGNDRLGGEAILAIADLPPLDALRGQLLGMLNTPASRLVRLLNTPGTQLARVLQAKAKKEQQ